MRPESVYQPLDRVGRLGCSDRVFRLPSRDRWRRQFRDERVRIVRDRFDQPQVVGDELADGRLVEDPGAVLERADDVAAALEQLQREVELALLLRQRKRGHRQAADVDRRRRLGFGQQRREVAELIEALEDEKRLEQRRPAGVALRRQTLHEQRKRKLLCVERFVHRSP